MRLLSSLIFASLCATAPALAQGRGGPDNAPAKGSTAPDFELHRLTAEGEQSEEKVKLSEVERPVALVFGSYT